MLQSLLAAFPRYVEEVGREAATARLFDEAGRLGRLYRQLEKVGKPVVAAINGTCVGGAFELALACHARFVADDDRIKLGLPEVRVGLMAGAGGSQRVGRLANPQEALQMLLKGEQLAPARAKALKLVDEVVPRSGPDRRGQALDPGDAAQGSAVGRGRLPAARRQGLFARRLQSLSGGERALSARDPRQLPRRSAPR